MYLYLYVLSHTHKNIIQLYILIKKPCSRRVTLYTISAMECPAGQVYYRYRAPCSFRCPDLSDTSDCGNEPPKEVCGCPDDEVLENGECLHESECNCVGYSMVQHEVRSGHGHTFSEWGVINFKY